MLKLSNRVKETSLTTGDGISIVLNGAFRGFESFANAIGDGNSTYYTIENGANFEIGIGSYTASSNTLSRDLVLRSSNSNARISLTDSSIVFCSYPAEYSVFLNEDGYASGQAPYYSGIAFPDGTIQGTAVNLIGSADNLAYFTDSSTIEDLENVSWNSSDLSLDISGSLSVTSNIDVGGYIAGVILNADNALVLDLSVDNDVLVSGDSLFEGNVDIDGTLYASNPQFSNPDLRDALFYRSAAGCFFHAYVDNNYDKMVALYSSNEANPYWRLGIKSYSTNYSTQPTVGYVEAENGIAGLYATSQDYIAIASTNGMWVGHQGLNLLNADADEGIIILNQNATAIPLTVRSAPSQSANLQEWTDYSSSVIASLNTDGRIAIDSIRFGDGTVQTTAASSSTENYRSISSSSDLSTNDGVVFVDCSLSNIELNLPSASGVGGSRITLKRKSGNYSLTVLPSGTEQIDGSSSFSIPYNYQSITVISDNLNWFIT